MQTPDGGEGGGERTRRSGRSRALVVYQSAAKSPSGGNAMKAAYEYLDALFDSPGAAAAHHGVERQHVNYYVRKLVNSGVCRSEKSVSGQTVSSDVVSSTNETVSPVCQSTNPYDVWCQAWTFAHTLGQEGQGKRLVAAKVSEKFRISFSTTSAQRAKASGGKLPSRAGRELLLPHKVELKLEDLCLCLRELNLPVFRFMILNYVNVLISGTQYAAELKDNEVKRAWYYRWLGRCTRLKTANLTPLEMTRAQWATAENAKKHYDMLVEVLLLLKLAVKNDAYDENVKDSVRIFITKPGRIFSMDESRLTNDMTTKNKSKGNRSIIGKSGDTGEFLANKGGGDGTGIGGSSSDGIDTPGFFIFANNIIHKEDVAASVRPMCRRADPNNPTALLPARFWCNEKGGVTGDLGVRWIRGCLEPSVPDMSPENPAVLIMDGHGSHFTLELLTYCRSIGLHVIIRPPHTTHILQGEDVVHFKIFKPMYHQAKMLHLGKKIFTEKTCKLTAADLLKVAKEPWEKAFNEHNTKNAWAEIGISPFTQCVWWKLKEKESKSKETAQANDIDERLLTVKGMVDVLFNRSGAAESGAAERGAAERTVEESEASQIVPHQGKKRDRDTLHSCDLWDLPGGATGDECYEKVKVKTDARIQKAAAIQNRKESSVLATKEKRAGSLEYGGAIVHALTDQGQLKKLKLDQLTALLLFKGADEKDLKNLKKPELVAKAESALSNLPQNEKTPALPALLPPGAPTEGKSKAPTPLALLGGGTATQGGGTSAGDSLITSMDPEVPAPEDSDGSDDEDF